MRHIDTACDYGNEKEVGQGLKRAFSEGLVTRDDLWITSKLWNTYHHKEHVLLAANKSLEDLSIDHFDLYLIHFPISQKFVPINVCTITFPFLSQPSPILTFHHYILCLSLSQVRYPPEWIFDPTSSSPRIELDPVPLQETWKGMQELVSLGKSRQIGVCNFGVQLLMDLLSYAVIKPAVLQVELHPLNSQYPLVRFCQDQGIHVTAFSPLGSPSYVELDMDEGLGLGLLLHQDILAIANKHNKTTAQVILKWNIQRGVSVVSKTTKASRLTENLVALDKQWQLDSGDMTTIDGLNQNKRFNDPGEFCKGMGGAIPIYA